MKKRPKWLRPLLLLTAVVLAVALIVDVRDYRDLMRADIFSPELKREVFLSRMSLWLMWGLMILCDLFSVIAWNWPREKLNRGEAVLLTVLLLGWAATGLIPDYMAQNSISWWVCAAALLLGTAYSWWRCCKHKNETMSSS